MSKYLFKISTRKTDCWSTKTPKPIYFVAFCKEDVEQWAACNLAEGLCVSKITKLAKAVGGSIFTAE